MNEQSNRVYGEPDKYINTESKPELSEEEQRIANARMRVAMRQQRLEEKADDYIDLINKNHGIKGDQVGEIKPTPIEIDQTKEYEYKQDVRYIARKRIEQRMEQRMEEKRLARNLKIKKALRVAVGIVLCGTLAGGTIAIINSTKSFENEPNNEPVIEQTEEEYQAGLTPEQLQEKQALDDAENARLQAIVDQANQLTAEHNQQVEDAIDTTYGRSR